MSEQLKREGSRTAGRVMCVAGGTSKPRKKVMSAVLKHRASPGTS